MERFKFVLIFFFFFIRTNFSVIGNIITDRRKHIVRWISENRSKQSLTSKYYTAMNARLKIPSRHVVRYKQSTLPGVLIAYAMGFFLQKNAQLPHSKSLQLHLLPSTDMQISPTSCLGRFSMVIQGGLDQGRLDSAADTWRRPVAVGLTFLGFLLLHWTVCSYNLCPGGFTLTSHLILEQN